MLKVRLIPVLYLMNGQIVRSEAFSKFQTIGNPLNELERFSEWRVDELVYADITREGKHVARSIDQPVKGMTDTLSVLREISRLAFMPLTFGGRIDSPETAETYILNGADKVLINTACYRTPSIVGDVARTHGSQAIVAGMDIKRVDGKLTLWIDQGRIPVKDDPIEYAKKLEGLGAGEILVNSIDRDGMGEGYDIAAVREIAAAVSIPVVAAGGAGFFDDFVDVVRDGHASAAAAGNIFHFTEHSYKRAKNTMKAKGLDVRFPYAS